MVRCAYVRQYDVCEISLTDDLCTSLKPALQLMVDRKGHLNFHDVDFKALSPSAFFDTLTSLNSLRTLGFYTIRNPGFEGINDRLLLALAKNGLVHAWHGRNTSHVTGDVSGRGIIEFLTYDNAQRSLTVNHPRLSPSFISDLIEAAKSGRIAGSDPPRKVLELYFESGTLDMTALAQYNSETNPPYSTMYFIDDKIKIHHYYSGIPYIQLLV